MPEKLSIDEGLFIHYFTTCFSLISTESHDGIFGIGFSIKATAKPPIGLVTNPDRS